MKRCGWQIGGLGVSLLLASAMLTDGATARGAHDSRTLAQPFAGVFTSQRAPYLSAAEPVPGSRVTVAVRADRGALTKVVLRYTDSATGKSGAVAMRAAAGQGAHELWTATLTMPGGGSLSYRFDLYDGVRFVCLAADGLHRTDTADNNFPLPVGRIAYEPFQAAPGEIVTGDDETGEFGAGRTTFTLVDARGRVVATVPGQPESWTNVQFQLPRTLPAGAYTVAARTVVPNPQGAIVAELDSASFLAVGSGHFWFDDLKHDSFSSFYRTPFGAVPAGTPVTLRLRGPAGLKEARVRLWNAGGNPNETDIPMRPVTLPAAAVRSLTGDSPGRFSWWQATIPASLVSVPGTMWYQFEADYHGAPVFYDDNAQQLEGIGGFSNVPGGPSYQLSVYETGFQTPSWLRHAVIYEIFPDRFFNGDIANDENPKIERVIGSLPDGREGLVPVQFHADWYSQPYDPAITANPDDPHYKEELALRGDGQWSTDFYGGDLRGIEYKLDYLKSLGVNTLYLTPIFESESNHKYDTGDFLKVDPHFGTLHDWLDLVRAAKARGMHILIDGAFEDTGSDSLYFNRFGAYPPHGAWQQYRGTARSPFYQWYDWTGNPSQPYDSWDGYDTLPLTNTDNPSYRHFVFGGPNSVAAYWVRMGAGGWRLDSADNGNFNIPWWSAFRREVKTVDPDAAIVGEIWNNATNDNGVDWLTGQTFDSVMNYQFRNAVLDFFRGTFNDGNIAHSAVDASGFNAELMRLYSEYPLPAFYAMMNLVDSHDTMRILTALAGAPQPDGMSAFAQAAWRPSLPALATGIARLKLVSDFQFTFPGAPTIYYGDEAGEMGYKDPLDRGPFPWGRETLTLLNHYRLLGAIRAANPVLQTGAFRPLLERGDVYAFARTITSGRDVFGAPEPDATAVVALNNQSAAETVMVPVGTTVADGVRMQDELTGAWHTVQNGVVTLHLEPYQGVILVESPRAPVACMREEHGRTLVAWTPVAGASAYRVLVERRGVWTAWPAGRAARSYDVTDLRGREPIRAAVEAVLSGKATDADTLSGGIGLVTSSPVITIPAVALDPVQVRMRRVSGHTELSWRGAPAVSRYGVYAENADGSYVLVATVPASVGQTAVSSGIPVLPGEVFRIAAANVDGYAVSAPVIVTRSKRPF